MGRLAGPVSDDRPDVPVWRYLAVADADPEIALSDLTAARFPVRYPEGTSSVTSVHEELKPLPSSYKGRRPTPRFELDARSVMRRYRALFDAGMVAWDAATRGIVYLAPPASWRAALASWADDEMRMSVTRARPPHSP